MNYPWIEIGCSVVANYALWDVDPDGRDVLVARAGDVGRVVERYPDAHPTVYWDKSNRVLDVEPSGLTVLGARVSEAW